MEHLTKTQLIAVLKQKNLKFSSKMKKQDLINILKESSAEKPVETLNFAGEY